VSWKERREFVPVEYGELEHVEDHDESHAARLATCANNDVKRLLTRHLRKTEKKSSAVS
jgi:hypothetical protein